MTEKQFVAAVNYRQGGSQIIDTDYKTFPLYATLADVDDWARKRIAKLKYPEEVRMVSIQIVLEAD
jgi:hypothetical protein